MDSERVLCVYRCGRDADGHMEGEGPLCVRCADAFLDRFAAMSFGPLPEGLEALRDDFWVRMR